MFEKIKNWFKKENPTLEEKPIPGTSEYYHEVERPEGEELASKTMVVVNVEKEVSCDEVILSRETKTYLMSQMDFDIKRNFDDLTPERVDEKILQPDIENYPEHLRKTTIKTFSDNWKLRNQVEQYIEKGAQVITEKFYSNGIELSSNHKTEYKPYGDMLVVKNYSHDEIRSVRNYDIKDKDIDFTKPIDLTKLKRIDKKKILSKGMER